MPSRHSTIALLILLSATAASRATPPALPAGVHLAPAAGSSHLMAFGGRSLQQRISGAPDKLDAALANLSAHAALVRPEHALSDLHALNPAIRFSQPVTASGPLVLIDAITRGDPLKLKAALQKLGLTQAAVYSNDVGGWLPISALASASLQAELHAMRAAMPRTRTGAVTSQGDFAQGSAALRSQYSTLTGTGITVGMLSDSFDCYAVYEKAGSGVPASGPNGYAQNGFLADAAQDMSTGDLPANVTVLAEADCKDYGQPDQLPFTDEGRAMLQIVHDVAPGAALAFYTAANSEADFAQGIGALQAAGAQVEGDDSGYFDEPFFQDGILAQAIDAVEAKGVAYFSAAGNNAEFSYENTAPSFATPGSGANAGENLLNFDASGASTTTALPVVIPPLVPGEYVGVVVEWDQPYVTGATGSPGASSRIDLCVTGGTGADQIIDLDGNQVTCSGANALGVDPVQILVIGNPAYATDNSAQQSLSVVIGLLAGSAMPGRIKLLLDADGAPVAISNFDSHSSTLQGHPGAAGALAIGAAFFANTPRCGVSPAILESFSSAGGAPILFDTSGNPLATPIIRPKPDVVGPDGVNTTFFGYPLLDYGAVDTSSVSQCANNGNFPYFFGTSAATPHVAASAALMLQTNAALSPAQIYEALRSSASPMDSTVPNFNSGYGFVQVDQALALLPPGAPALTLSSSSVSLGSSSTLSWTSINTTACTASGGWSGSVALSGSRTVTPAATGQSTYTLTCSNAQGSAARSVTLSVAAAAAHSSGGGGGLSGDTLLLLAALAAADRIRRARRRAPARA